MSVRWHSSFASGNPEIDGQHRELFRRLAELVAALERGRRDELPRLRDVLRDGVVSQLGAAERAMAACAPPAASVHAAADARFVKKYGELRTLRRVEDVRRRAQLPVSAPCADLGDL